MDDKKARLIRLRKKAELLEQLKHLAHLREMQARKRLSVFDESGGCCFLFTRARQGEPVPEDSDTLPYDVEEAKKAAEVACGLHEEAAKRDAGKEADAEAAARLASALRAKTLPRWGSDEAEAPTEEAKIEPVEQAAEPSMHEDGKAKDQTPEQEQQGIELKPEGQGHEALETASGISARIDAPLEPSDLDKAAAAAAGRAQEDALQGVDEEAKDVNLGPVDKNCKRNSVALPPAWCAIPFVTPQAQAKCAPKAKAKGKAKKELEGDEPPAPKRKAKKAKVEEKEALEEEPPSKKGKGASAKQPEVEDPPQAKRKAKVEEKEAEDEEPPSKKGKGARAKQPEVEDPPQPKRKAKKAKVEEKEAEDEEPPLKRIKGASNAKEPEAPVKEPASSSSGKTKTAEAKALLSRKSTAYATMVRKLLKEGVDKETAKKRGREALCPHYARYGVRPKAYAAAK